MNAFPEIFAIIDTETTGMRPGFARLTDIAIIRVEKGKVVRRFESLLNPGLPIPPSITRFTGITDEMVQDAPSFDEVALQVKELLDGAVFVAHNVAFDYGFVKAEFARIGVPFEAETLCSVQLSRTVYPKERGHSLDAVIARCNLSCENRHRAMPDAQAVWDFFQHLDATVAPKTLASAVQHVRQGFAVRTNRTRFTELPDSAGVYFFYGPEQELLYIGKSKHVRSRVRSHFRGGISNKEIRIQEDTRSIESVRTSGELSALLLESSLIKKESPLFNRMLRRKKVLVVAKRRVDSEGYMHVTLERSHAITPDGSILGVFRTTTQGREVLRTLAQQHRVCEKLIGIEQSKGECFGVQIGKCDGACVAKLSSEEHNARLEEAFKGRKLRTWPYPGPIMIKEAESEERGTVFFIDNWALVGAFTYESGEFQPFVEASGDFDYDMYKIFSRFMRKKANKRSIQALTKKQFTMLYSQCTGEGATIS